MKHLPAVDRRIVVVAPLSAMVSKQNEELANKVGNYKITVYNDWNKEPLALIRGHPDMLQTNLGGYFLLITHLACMSRIVWICRMLTQLVILAFFYISCLVTSRSYLRKFKRVWRCSCVWTDQWTQQLDNIPVLAKLVTTAGDDLRVFLDLEQPSARGADSYCAAANTALNKTTTWSAALSWLMVTIALTQDANIASGKYWPMTETIQIAISRC